jgi:hypothetical protein
MLSLSLAVGVVLVTEPMVEAVEVLVVTGQSVLQQQLSKTIQLL